jgi:hypothetical protein
VAANTATVTVNEGQTASNTGTFSDPGVDTVSLTASVGTIIATGSGTWSWSYATSDGPDQGQTVTIIATDSDNAATTTTFALVVNNVAPTLTLSGDANVNEGATYTLNLAHSDPGADTITQWVITWGDGNVVTITSSPASVTHIYADGPHDYIISATATDEDGAYNAGNTVSVHVNNVAPTVTAPDGQAANEGTSTSFTLGSFTDPGADSPWAVDVNWGDSSSHTTFTATAAGSLGTQLHTYATPNTYTVIVQVTDDGAPATASFQVTVNNVPPTNVEAGGPYSVIAGESVTLHGTATCAPGDTCTYAWDLGSSETAGQDVSFSRNTVGTYTVTLRVTDEEGAWATDSATVTVTGATHSITLAPGWNLVSFNLHPVSTGIADVLASLGGWDLVYAWDAQNQTWLKYDNVPLSIDSLSTLDKETGFWIHMTASATLNVVGSIPSTTGISLLAKNSGWNLVSYPANSNSNGALPAALYAHGVEDHFSLVYAYNPTDTDDPWKLFDREAPEWANDLTALSPLQGYWVKVSADCTWHVDYP